jgi:hypothetical protein
LSICSEHDPICYLFELILVIHANTSNETNHILVDISRSHGCNDNEAKKQVKDARK